MMFNARKHKSFSAYVYICVFVTPAVFCPLHGDFMAFQEAFIVTYVTVSKP